MGFQMIICNRPDHEDIGQPTAKVIAEECKQFEILFHHIPLLNAPFENQSIKMQQTLVNECDGPVLAYCRSGQRSAQVWHVGLGNDTKF